MTASRTLLGALVGFGVFGAMSPAAFGSPATPPDGHVAQVTDRSSSKLTVKSFSFGYTYGYTRSNCMFSCWASADGDLHSAPVKDGCGTRIVPFSSIKSIALAPSAKGQPRATVTLVDGNVITGEFGRFGSHAVAALKGRSSLGDYSLPLEKASEVVFQHGAASPPKEQSWGDGGGKATAAAVCADGTSLALAKAAFYKPPDSGEIGSYNKSKLRIKVGESMNDIEFGRIKAIARAPKPAPKAGSRTTATAEEDRITLTTQDGDTIDATIQSDDYLGGYRDGFFYYVRVKDLKGISVD